MGLLGVPLPAAPQHCIYVPRKLTPLECCTVVCVLPDPLCGCGHLQTLRHQPRHSVGQICIRLPETAASSQVDVTLNNRLAITNTQLLSDYSRIDGRLAQLVFVVKHWARQRQTNDAYRGTLSS